MEKFIPDKITSRFFKKVLNGSLYITLFLVALYVHNIIEFTGYKQLFKENTREVIANYLLYSLPDFLVFVIPPCLCLAFVRASYTFHKNNYFTFMILKAATVKPLYYATLWGMILSSLLLFTIQQSVTKPAKKRADIIFEDDLIKNKELVSQLSIANRKFHKLEDNKFIYFTNFTPDPIAETKPVLTEVLYWEQSLKNDHFYFSKNTQIENETVILHTPLSLDFNHETGSFTMNIQETKILKNTFEFPVNKIESVHLSSLTLTELFQLKKTAQALSLTPLRIYLYIALPFIHLLLAPLIVIVFAQRTILRQYI